MEVRGRDIRDSGARELISGAGVDIVVEVVLELTPLLLLRQRDLKKRNELTGEVRLLRSRNTSRNIERRSFNGKGVIVVQAGRDRTPAAAAESAERSLFTAGSLGKCHFST